MLKSFFDGVMERRARTLFDHWKDSAANPSCEYHTSAGITHQACNDQGPFSDSVRRTNTNPFVLPHNWNLVPRWNKIFFGPVKIIHGHFEGERGSPTV